MTKTRFQEVKYPALDGFFSNQPCSDLSSKWTISGGSSTSYAFRFLGFLRIIVLLFTGVSFCSSSASDITSLSNANGQSLAFMSMKWNYSSAGSVWVGAWLRRWSPWGYCSSRCSPSVRKFCTCSTRFPAVLILGSDFFFDRRLLKFLKNVFLWLVLLFLDGSGTESGVYKSLVPNFDFSVSISYSNSWWVWNNTDPDAFLPLIFDCG